MMKSLFRLLPVVFFALFVNQLAFAEEEAATPPAEAEPPSKTEATDASNENQTKQNETAASAEEAANPPQPEETNETEMGEIESIDELGELEELEALAEAEVAEEEQLNFFELNGYFRFRADLFHKLDLGVINNLKPLGDHNALPSLRDNIEREDNTIGSANMRLRLAPTLNVSEDIKIKMEVDVLDNLVLGTTPDTYLKNYGALAPGISGFSSSQVPPRSGSNSDVNSIEIRRAWAEIRTPVGLIKVGRQPSHWGTGMYINDGNCIDCDYGDTVDRLLFGTKLFEHVLFASLDYVNEGLTDDSNFEYGGQNKDATQYDDVQQIAFGFARKHSDAEVEELIENDDVSVNYGFYNVVRWQSYALEQTSIGDNTTGSFTERKALRSKMQKRNLKLYVGDLWFRLLWKRLHLELEGIWITGKIGSAALDVAEENAVEKSGVDPSVSINQYAWVLQLDYKFLDDALFVGAEWGWASGDDYHYPETDQYYNDVSSFGVYPYLDRQYASSKYRDTKYGPYKTDRSVTNFRFDPDYIVDMILFREIIGTVTGATYIKPTVQYNITPDIGARFDAIISWALEGESTPAYYHAKYETLDEAKRQTDPVKRKIPKNALGHTYMGTELNFTVFYKSSDGFGTKLQYGVFFPGDCWGYFDPGHTLADGTQLPTWFGSSDVAQSLQWHLTVDF